MKRLTALLVALLLAFASSAWAATDLDGTKYNEVDSSNTTASPDGWPSGITGTGAVNTGRQMMGATKRAFDREHGGSWVTVGGTANAITLTYTTAPTAYIQGQRFAFKASATNTAATTINVNALGALNVYNRLAPLVGGEIVNGAMVVVDYDGTQLQLVSASPASDAVAGGVRNFKAVQASNTTVTVTYDEAVVKTALGGATYLGKSGSFTLNTAGTGANGLDTGTLGASTFYSLYVIYNPATQTFATLACTAAASTATIYAGANLPSGYTASALVGAFLTDGSSHIRAYTQLDREVFYTGGLSVFAGTAGVTVLTSQSLSAVVPGIAKTVSGILSGVSGATGNPIVAADSSATASQQNTGTGGSVTNVVPALSFRQVPLLTSQTIYWNVGSAANSWSMTAYSYTF